MPTVLTDRCPKCGNAISYTTEATKLQCPFCDYSFLVVEFISERLKMEKAQSDSEQARKDLAAAEAEKAQLQNRLNGTLTALEAIETSQNSGDKKLDSILASLKADRQTHEAMKNLLHAVQQDQRSGQDALTQLLRALMKEQNSAADKLAVVQDLSAQILHAQQSGAKAVEHMQDVVLERIEALDMKARDRFDLFADFRAWSKAMQQADVQRLQKLQASSDTLLQGQKAMTAKLDGLSDAIANTKASVDKGFDELRRKHLDKLIELYHQATGLQHERKFDRAEEKYLELLSEGGPTAQDAEIYWRLLLCHYGVEYQEENGKTIPIILRPDLADPSTMQVRKDLSAHIKTEQQKAHYAERLNKIDSYLQRYREVRLDPAWEFDVFISVKQNDNGRQTKDSDAASELYNYFIQDSALAAKKLRVFNSRYTHLPVGEAYEPYIITALMSAKVLIVVGSSPEYMNSQWVRNEWSRFQYLQERERRQGKTERRLFCYLTGGMQPRQLPAALNPDKQVLTEGPTTGIVLREIMNKAFPDRVAPAPVPAHVPGPKPMETPEAIAKRMKALLMLGQYQQVTELFVSIQKTRAEILLEEPWLCMHALCAQRRVRTIEELAMMGAELCADSLFSFSYRYADASLRSRLDALRESAVLHSKETAYQNARALANKGRYEEASKAFKALRDYKDAAINVNECAYQIAMALMNKSNYQEACRAFKALGDYQGAAAKANECAYRNAMALMNKGNYQEACRTFKTLGDYKDAAAKANECITSQRNETAYKNAMALMNKGNYQEAINAFMVLRSYKDSAEKVTTLRNKEEAYQKAMALMNNGCYQEAANAFEALNHYKDSSGKVKECTIILQSQEKAYQKAVAMMNKGSYEEAINAFKELGDYRNSTTKANECTTLQSKENAYQRAMGLMNNGCYQEAIHAFAILGDYRDSAAKALDNFRKADEAFRERESKAEEQAQRIKQDAEDKRNRHEKSNHAVPPKFQKSKKSFHQTFIGKYWGVPLAAAAILAVLLIGVARLLYVDFGGILSTLSQPFLQNQVSAQDILVFFLCLIPCVSAGCTLLIEIINAIVDYFR